MLPQDAPQAGANSALAALESTRVGRYALREILGRGGMGVVYLAYDAELGRELALKICNNIDARTAVRVHREATALAKLEHPNVLEIYDIGRHDGFVFIAMEYACGGTARARYRERKPWRDVLDFYLGAARGLAAAHHANIVHRDFKPENVLAMADGTAKVADFGLATGGGATRGSRADLSSMMEPGVRVTRKGALVGTPAFMAPEQLLGLEVDARADQFAFCAALFEGLYGERPFPGATIQERRANLGAHGVRWPEDRRGVPKSVQRALTRGMDKDRERRFASMDALIAALSRPRRRGVLGWSAAAVTTTALVALARPAGEAPAQCSLRPLARVSVEQKQQLTEALSAYDPGAPEYVLSELDQFSASWEAERRTSCATSVALPRAAATRMCLARTQQAYDARLHLLLEESPEALARANDLVHNLPPPDTCRTPEARHAGLELSDLQRRVVTRLARASANFDAGRYSEALKHSDEALALASDLGQPSLLARSLTSHADTHAVLSLPAEAIELYEEAFLLAKEHGLDTIARRSALGAAPLHARIGQREQAERWLDAAASEVARAGSTPTMRARLHLARARALDYFEQFDAGRDEVDKGLALTEDPRLRLSLVGRLTSLNERSGLAPALRLPDCHRRIDLALQVFGASHPQVATAYMHLAKVLAYDDPKTAQDAYESAREIFERSSGPNNPSLVRLDAKLARAQSDAGDPDAAEESFRRAITLQEQLSPDDRTLVALNTNFGALLEGRGRTREARQRHERARVLADAVFGPSSIEAAVTRVNLAAGLLGTAGVARAVELLEQALPTFEPRLDRSHFNLTPVVANLVQAYVETGRFEDAAAALETLRAASNDGDENQGVIERLQAQLDAALGHVPRAIRSTRRCINRPFESPLAPTRLLCLELAAILIHTHGRPTELRALLRPELETLRDPSALPRPAARLLFLLATTERHRPTAQRLAGEALERLDGASGEIADTLRARIQAEFGAVP